MDPETEEAVLKSYPKLAAVLNPDINDFMRSKHEFFSSCEALKANLVTIKAASFFKPTHLILDSVQLAQALLQENEYASKSRTFLRQYTRELSESIYRAPVTQQKAVCEGLLDLWRTLQMPDLQSLVEKFHVPGLKTDNCQTLFFQIYEIAEESNSPATLVALMPLLPQLPIRPLNGVVAQILETAEKWNAPDIRSALAAQIRHLHEGASLTFNCTLEAATRHNDRKTVIRLFDCLRFLPASKQLPAFLGLLEAGRCLNSPEVIHEAASRLHALPQAQQAKASVHASQLMVELDSPQSIQPWSDSFRMIPEDQRVETFRPLLDLATRHKDNNALAALICMASFLPKDDKVQALRLLFAATQDSALLARVWVMTVSKLPENERAELADEFRQVIAAIQTASTKPPSK